MFVATMKRLTLLLIIFLWSCPAFAQSVGGVVGGPVLPQVVPSAAYPFTSQYPSYTITPVASAANLQMAISGAACGTKLNLAHGGSFANGGTAYTLPNNSCACHTDQSKWIIIQGDQFEANYSAGVRVDPSTQYSQFPHVSSSDPSFAFTANANGASCWGFAGLDVYPTVTGTNALFAINGAQSQTPANFSHDFAWWGMYMHGQPTFGLTRGIILNGNWETVVDSYCSDMHTAGQDSQCLVSWDGYGPHLFQNNFLEASTENTMFGGSPSTAGVMMSDITIKGNYYYKPLSWSINDPSYYGNTQPGVVKDLIEFKSGQRILVTGNVFEHTWGAGQNEFEIINSNCSISSPSVNFVQDVTEYYNIFRNATTEWFVFGGCAQPTTQPDHRIWLHDNLIYGLEGCSAASCGFTRFVDVASGQAVGVPFPAYDLWITHNTGSVSNYGSAHFNQDGSDGKTYYGHQFINNVFGEANIPQAQGSFYTRVVGSGLAEGDSTYTTNFPGGNFRNNCYFGVIGGTYTNAAFSNTKNPANAAAVFVNPGTDFHVAKTSVCSGAASDGLDMGANIDAVNSATSGVATLPANLPTVTNVSPSTFTHSGGTGLTLTGTNFNSADTALAVVIGGAGPVSTVSSMVCTNNVSCVVTMSAAITLSVNDTINVQGIAQNGGASLPLGQFTVSSVTDTTHFSFTVGATISTATFTGGTINRYTPGNACTSIMVTSSTTITCNAPAATGTVTTGPVSVFVSQWGIPVQSTVFPSYN